MTGLECLRAELRERGFTAKQTESKTLLAALEIISNAPGRYTDIDRLQEEIKTLEDMADNMRKTRDITRETLKTCKAELNSIIEQVNKEAEKHYRATMDYIDSFFKALEDCETPEARDALKAAQMFVNTVKVDTKYDNTAFIIGLAAILSQGNIGSVDKLREINTKIPEIEFEARPGMIYGPSMKPYSIGTKEKTFRQTGRRF